MPAKQQDSSKGKPGGGASRKGPKNKKMGKDMMAKGNRDGDKGKMPGPSSKTGQKPRDENTPAFGKKRKGAKVPARPKRAVKP